MKILLDDGTYAVTVHTTKVDGGFDGVAVVSLLQGDHLIIGPSITVGPCPTRGIAKHRAKRIARLPSGFVTFKEDS